VGAKEVYLLYLHRFGDDPADLPQFSGHLLGHGTTSFAFIIPIVVPEFNCVFFILLPSEINIPDPFQPS
jgi:hypothetical protein